MKTRVRDLFTDFLKKNNLQVNVSNIDSVYEIQKEMYKMKMERYFDIFLKMVIDISLQEIKSQK